MQATSSKSARNFVLVHGAGHGGWCYSRVADRLRAAGHRVFTPTLAGLAERAAENVMAINLTTHINEILNLFKWHDLDDVVLCGHSYGGMVVGGVADKIPERIGNLVFLDAVIPENGKCMTEYVFQGEMLQQILDAVGALGGLFLPAAPAAFFNVNEADRAMVDRLCTPHPMASLLEKISIGTAADAIAQHTYIYATEWGNPAIAQQYQRAKTLPGWKTFEVQSGHDIMIDAPARLAEILSSLD